MIGETLIEAIERLKTLDYAQESNRKICERLQDSLPEIYNAYNSAISGKYDLELYIYYYTDNDATLEYNGKKYCNYNTKLDIKKSFDSLTEITEFFQKEIEVYEGTDDADKYLEFFDNTCMGLFEHDFELAPYSNSWDSVHTMEVSVRFNK